MLLQLRSKRSELPPNLDALRRVEIAYHAEWDSFTSVSRRPTSIPGRTAVAFGNPLDYDLLGWRPDGKVRGSYACTSASSGPSGADDFTADAMGDIDGDSTPSVYSSNRTDKPFMVTSNNIY